MMGEATTSTASAFNAFPVLFSWANPRAGKKKHRAIPNHPLILCMTFSPFSNAFFGFHSAGTSPRIRKPLGMQGAISNIFLKIVLPGGKKIAP
jgi:hypothetical protein